MSLLTLIFNVDVSRRLITVAQTANEPSAGISTPIYIVGSLTLAQQLTQVGINGSFIKLITMDQLTDVPNDSIVIINWSVIKPSVIINDPGNKVTINLTSPVIRDLAIAIARGDVVSIYASGNDESIAEFILAYSWAVATNNTLRGLPAYLVAYPVIPVKTHGSVLFMASHVKQGGLMTGPIYLSKRIQLLLNAVRPNVGLGTINGISDAADPDPCFIEYLEFMRGSSSAPGIYTNNKATFVWILPIFYQGPPYGGIPGYSDDNGTYYWDTCLLIGNTAYAVSPDESAWYWLPINVFGYEGYLELSTMYNNLGYLLYQLGSIDYYYGYEQYRNGVTNALVGDEGNDYFSTNSWNPPPMSSVFSYYMFTNGILGFSPTLLGGVGVPPGPGESIGGFLNPSMLISLPNGPAVQVGNITWVFSIGYGANDQGFTNAFEDITPAGVFIRNMSSPSIAMFRVDFENTVVTAQYPCAYEVLQTIWVDVTWNIIVIPKSSTTVTLSQSSVGLSITNAPPNTYVTGVTSYIVPILCAP
ncbi:hypothetical protein [Vulcanisaeta sp. JCM 14467]